MAGIPRTRTKSAYVDYGTGHWSSDVSSTAYSSYLVKFKTTTDEIKHGWTNPPPEWDAGGQFLSTSYEGTLSPFYGRTSGKLFQNRKFEGPMLPALAYSDGTVAQQRASSVHWYDSEPAFIGAKKSDSQLDALGTTAISQSAPTNPHASAFNMLGELRRDGLPAISGIEAFRRRGKPSALGSEYLNYEFGIKPLLSDLTKLGEAIRDSKKILSQYRRDAGKRVARRYTFPREIFSTSSSSTGFNVYPSLDSYYWDSTSCNNSRSTTVEVRRWFSGAFVYRIPDLEGPMGTIARITAEMNHLFGITPTPIALWNLTPWTWAADWFTNIGDVMNNASMFLSDGLLLHHGYVMEQVTMINSNYVSGPVLKGGSAVYASRSLKVISKRRRRATPFGFGLNEDSLSPRQWAIIAALGLSQGGRYVAK